MAVHFERLSPGLRRDCGHETHYFEPDWVESVQAPGKKETWESISRLGTRPECFEPLDAKEVAVPEKILLLESRLDNFEPVDWKDVAEEDAEEVPENREEAVRLDDFELGNRKGIEGQVVYPNFVVADLDLLGHVHLRVGPVGTNQGHQRISVGKTSVSQPWEVMGCHRSTVPVFLVTLLVVTLRLH